MFHFKIHIHLPRSKDLTLTYDHFSAHRWKEGRSIKLEGSDHAPVYVTLLEIPNVSLHSTPSLSARYVPTVHGLQQTLGTTVSHSLCDSFSSCYY